MNDLWPSACREILLETAVSCGETLGGCSRRWVPGGMQVANRNATVVHTSW
jgi:hypothetical protein